MWTPNFQVVIAALDLRDPPTLPKYVLLHRARGVEDVYDEDLDNETARSDTETAIDDSRDKSDMLQATRSHGDS